MTREEIIEMARQAGFLDYELDDGTTDACDKRYEAFAKLVAEHERERCAEICDVLAVHPEYASSITKLAAQAIRNRGQA